MFCDFNRGFHIEVNRTVVETKGVQNDPPYYTKVITSRNRLRTFEITPNSFALDHCDNSRSVDFSMAILKLLYDKESLKAL